MSSNAPISAMQGLQLLQNAQNKTQDNQNKLDVLSTQNVLSAKQIAVDAAKKQAQGQMIDSVTKFAGSTVGMNLNNRLHDKQAKLTSVADKEMYSTSPSSAGAKVAKLQNLTNNGQVPALSDKATDALSNTIGGAAMKNEGDVLAKQADAQETIAKGVQDGTQKLKEQVQKGIDGLNDWTKNVFDRATQAVNNIASKI